MCETTSPTPPSIHPPTRQSIHYTCLLSAINNARTSWIISISSASVGFWPNDRITVPSSLVVMVPAQQRQQKQRQQQHHESLHSDHKMTIPMLQRRRAHFTASTRTTLLQHASIQSHTPCTPSWSPTNMQTVCSFRIAFHSTRTIHVAVVHKGSQAHNDGLRIFHHPSSPSRTNSPSPSLSKRLKASLNSAICSSVS
jgi:hypothetical protein